MAEIDRPLLLAYDSGSGDLTRAFRPSEFEKLIVAMARKYPRYYRIPVVLLLTGLRYAELLRFLDNEQRHAASPVQRWFVPGERMIDPMGQIISLKKREKGMSRSRRIYLSDMGVQQVQKFLDEQNGNTLPSQVYMDWMLEKSAEIAQLQKIDRDVIQRPYVRDISGNRMHDPAFPKSERKWLRNEKQVHFRTCLVSTKTFRKTCTSWKIVLYPNLEGWIAASMGHSVETARRYYQERGFTRDDIKGMVKYFDGMAPPTLEDIKAEMEVKE